jgi:hypothetical protein
MLYVGYTYEARPESKNDREKGSTGDAHTSCDA